jgi:hypothetical protein
MIFTQELEAIFNSFLDNLDLWESQHFSKLSMEVDCFNFFDLVNNQNLAEGQVQLITISDG